MRFTKKQVKEIVSKKINKNQSKKIAFAMLFGIVFGMIISACYVLNADTVNTYWQKQFQQVRANSTFLNFAIK